jgi:hypothetical protein
MTNNQIVLYIYNNININGIVYKLNGKDPDEISQIVYEVVLKYDNDKLNNIFNNGALLSFVYIICRNQISNLKRVKFEELDNDIEEELEEESNNKLKFIEDEFKVVYQSTINKMTENEKQYFVKKLILKNKIYNNWTLTEMKNIMGISRNTLNDIVVSIKKELKEKYEKNKNNERYNC